MVQGYKHTFVKNPDGRAQECMPESVESLCTKVKVKNFVIVGQAAGGGAEADVGLRADQRGQVHREGHDRLGRLGAAGIASEIDRQGSGRRGVVDPQGVRGAVGEIEGREVGGAMPPIHPLTSTARWLPSGSLPLA